MNTKEFSDGFDVRLASYIYNNSVFTINRMSFDEYEKSVFLSQAQESLVMDLYSGRNIKGLSFDNTEESKRLLHSLIKNYEKEIIKSDTYTPAGVNDTFYISKVKLPTDVLAIIHEYANNEEESYKFYIVPTKYDNLDNLLKNPFKGPYNHRALRLESSENSILFYTKEKSVKNYFCTYLKKPSPIILEDLEGVSINDISARTECELDSLLHNEIIDRAVRLALQSKAGLLNNK